MIAGSDDIIRGQMATEKECIERFVRVVRQLGANALKFRALGSRQLRSLITTIARGLDNSDRILMLTRLADFSHACVVKSLRRDRLIGLGMLRSMFEVEVYRSVEGRVGALNLLYDVLEADRASDYDTQSVGAASALLGKLSATAVLKPEVDLLVIRYLVPALDWLVDPRYEIRRYAGALILFQFLSSAPTMIYGVRDFSILLERLWSALIDSSLVVREAASLATSGILQNSQLRQGDGQVIQLYKAATGLISLGLTGDASRSQIHAAVLLLRMVLKHVSSCMRHSYRPTLSWPMLHLSDSEQASWCHALLSTRGAGAKDGAVQAIALETIPLLSLFVREPLLPRSEAAKAILGTLRMGAESRVGYLALGRLSMVVASSFLLRSVKDSSVLENITSAVICRLNAENMSVHCYNEIVLCLAMVIKSTSYFHTSLSHSITHQITLSLPSIFDKTFSPSVVYIATIIFETLPALSEALQQCIFSELMLVIHNVSTEILTINEGIVQPTCKLEHRMEAKSEHRRFYLTYGMSFRALGILECSIHNYMYRAIASTIVGGFGLADAAFRYEIALLCFRCLELAIDSAKALNAEIGTMIERLIWIASADACVHIRSMIASKLSSICKIETTSSPRLLGIFYRFLSRCELQVKQVGGQILASHPAHDLFTVSTFLNTFVGVAMPTIKLEHANPQQVALCSPACSAFSSRSERSLANALEYAHFASVKSGTAVGQHATPLLIPVLELFQITKSRHVAKLAAEIIGDLSAVVSAQSFALVEGALPRMVDLLCHKPSTLEGGERALVRALAQVVNSTGAVATPVCWRCGQLVDVLWKQYHSVVYRNDCSTLLGSLGAISPYMVSQMRHDRATMCISADVRQLHSSIQQNVNFWADSSFKGGLIFRSDTGSRIHPFIISMEHGIFKQHHMLSIEEHCQQASFNTVLGMMSKSPELKKQALLALVQVCRTFHHSSLSLGTAINYLMSMLVAAPGGNLNPLVIGSANLTSEMLLQSLSQILSRAAPSLVARSCQLDRVTRALAHHWSCSISGGGGIIAVVIVLKLKMRRHLFSALLSRVLPPMLGQVECSPFRVARSTDLLSETIASSEQLQTVLSFLMCRSVFHYHRFPGTQCLMMICALRLIHRMTSSSGLSQIIPSFLFRLIDLINPRRVTQIHGTLEFINDDYLFLEIMIGGLVVAAKHLGLRFMPYVASISSALTAWLKLFENTTGTLRSALTESFLVCSTSRISPAVRVHSAAVAIAEYCGMVRAIAMGDVPPLSKRLLYVLDGAYDEIILDMATCRLSNRQPPEGLDMAALPRSPSIVPADWTFEINALLTSEDWTEWMRRVTVELLRESDLPHLRACTTVGEIHQPSAFRLFQVATLAVMHSYDSVRTPTGLAGKILRGLKFSMQANLLAGDCVAMILNLALFMRAHHSPLLIDFSNVVSRTHYTESLGVFVQERATSFVKIRNTTVYDSEGSGQTATKFDCAWVDSTILQLRECINLLDYHGVLKRASLLWGRLACNMHKSTTSAIPQCGLPRGGAGAAAAAVKAQWMEVNMVYEAATLGVEAAWALQKWDDMAKFMSFWGSFSLSSIKCVCARPTNERVCSRCLAAAAAVSHDKPHELLFSHAALILGIESTNCMPASIGMLDAHSFLQAARLSFLQHTSRPGIAQIFFLQRIQEMQEVIDHLTTPKLDVGHAHESLCLKWRQRLVCWAHPDPLHLSRLMMVRTLVLSPIEKLDLHITLAILCQNMGRPLACMATLRRLQPLLIHLSPPYNDMPFSSRHLNQLCRLNKISDPDYSFQRARANICPTITSMHICYQISLVMWEIGDGRSAYHYLFCLSQALLRNRQKYPKITLSSLTTRSEWCVALTQIDCWTEHHNSLNEAHSLMSLAIQFGPHTPQAWFAWGLTNHKLSEEMTRVRLGRAPWPNISVHGCQDHSCYVIESICGFLRSIELFDINREARNDTVIIQAMLMTISLWFKYGSWSSAIYALKQGLAKSSVGIWLGVLPQLIAHLDHAALEPRLLLTHLLTRIGHVHPQALIYPLTISGKSPVVSRRDASFFILCNLQACLYASQANKTLVAEAGLVACELHRAAITWHEAWFQGIENAANLQFGECDLRTTLEQLGRLHSCWRHEVSLAVSLLARVACNRLGDAARILAFSHAHGCEVELARRHLHQFLLSRRDLDLHQAWDVYSILHRRLKQRISSVGCEILELCHIAPMLLSVRNLSLAVPGTSLSAGDKSRTLPICGMQQCGIIHITSFSLKANIICSKQRPRRIKIHGSDGESYDFLLKGNEDLRQDERVMQLCGLINCLLAQAYSKCEPALSAQGLMQITRYAVMPLSNNSGLLEWVSNCCTVHSLIAEHRNRFSIQTDAESSCSQIVAPAYSELCSPGKLEAFSYSLARTKGIDLARMLWLNSEAPCKWLSIRQRFTLTLGLNSMVGFIIGLGDRHLSNIMVNHLTGDVVHIDFGDCFDVASQRAKFPEYVPFRLTRQLISVMEVDGVKGIFRLVCNHAIRVMRAECLSLTAVLEALVHDPLIGLSVILPASPRRSQCFEGTLEVPSQEAAIRVVALIQDKLTGRVVRSGDVTAVEDQVLNLIHQARSRSNICQMFFGWCPFW